MPSFDKVFGNKPVLLAVIHVVNKTQALHNTNIARDEGANGVFLISHGRLRYHELNDVFDTIRLVCRDYWIGINYLELVNQEALRNAPLDANGLWVDNAEIFPKDSDPTSRARLNDTTRKSVPFSGLYFGGVAFKYQQRVDDPGEAARIAKPFVDVITTSGDRTGSPPSIGKIKLIREAIGNHPLAIASGITQENVSEYIPYTNCFLVATGISKTFTELDPARVKELVHKLSG